MNFYSIVNIKEEEYEKDPNLYRDLVNSYKNQASSQIKLELSLSSFALKENLKYFKGIKNLSIGSVFKETQLKTLLKLKELGFFKLNEGKTEVFCPVLILIF